ADTGTRGLLLESATETPPLGEAPESVTVQVVDCPEFKVLGAHAKAPNVRVGGLTVNATVLLVPPDVVTDTVPLARAELRLMVNVVVICVALATLTALTVIPLSVLTVAPATKRVPVKVTATLPPCVPLDGLMEVSVGPGALTVNGTVLLAPLEVVTD